MIIWFFFNVPRGCCGCLRSLNTPIESTHWTLITLHITTYFWGEAEKERTSFLSRTEKNLTRKSATFCGICQRLNHRKWPKTTSQLKKCRKNVPQENSKNSNGEILPAGKSHTFLTKHVSPRTECWNSSSSSILRITQHVDEWKRSHHHLHTLTHLMGTIRSIISNR